MGWRDWWILLLWETESVVLNLIFLTLKSSRKTHDIIKIER